MIRNPTNVLERLFIAKKCLLHGSKPICCAKVVWGAKNSAPNQKMFVNVNVNVNVYLNVNVRVNVNVNVNVDFKRDL